MNTKVKALSEELEEKKKKFDVFWSFRFYLSTAIGGFSLLCTFLFLPLFCSLSVFDSWSTVVTQVKLVPQRVQHAISFQVASSCHSASAISLPMLLLLLLLLLCAHMHADKQSPKQFKV